jgi:hypothetical protein
VLRLEKSQQDNSGIDATGTYTLKQNAIGFAGRVDRAGRVSVVTRANNCINYTLTGNSHEISVTKWKNFSGAVYYFSFTGVQAGVPWTLGGVVSGGNLHDLCSGPSSDSPVGLFVMQVYTGGAVLPNGTGSQFYNLYVSH